jgi:6-pyruvoyltetrahydropterin/6-carboxytetrahydropterin synthase
MLRELPERVPKRGHSDPFQRTPGTPAAIFATVTSAFKVSVSKEYLGFSSAHFITLSGHQCESLHGHNYRIGVTVEGAVDPECAFVVDFAVLKRIVRPYVQEVDHRVILPTRNPKLVLTTEGDRLLVDYLGARRFVFPASNCALLPVSNTTAEMIAEYLAHRLRDDLLKEGLTNLESLEVEVEESVGQAGYYRLLI